MRLLHIGFGNFVSLDKIVSIVNPETSVGKRLREAARENDTLVDCTMGRKLRSMILTGSPYTFLSCVNPESLLQRVNHKNEDDIDMT